MTTNKIEVVVPRAWYQGRNFRPATYTMRDRHAEEARRHKEEQLERERSGEAERQRLQAMASKLQQELRRLAGQDRYYGAGYDCGLRQVGKLLIKAGDARLPQSVEELTHWIEQAEVLRKEAKAELQRQAQEEHERRVQERKFYKQRMVGALEDVRVFLKSSKREADEGLVAEANELVELGMLPQADFLVLQSRVCMYAREERRFEDLLEEYADWADTVSERGGVKLREDKRLHRTYGTYSWLRRGKTIDRDKRRTWRREVQALRWT
ncbi:hypothetical protein A2753_04110 [Candidatus Uhrbacteria bacterium RIFCSPHIGHO2_01_FULL_47_11]|nr:MAG: hypothetical protein A2753_04110 [Candidatus Uhrbacteria bacterium RIFCSPHIGHO2_01_FULL_47_11]